MAVPSLLSTLPSSPGDIGSQSAAMIQPTRTVHSVSVNSVTDTTLHTTTELNSQTIIMRTETTDPLSSSWSNTETSLSEVSSTIPVLSLTGNVSFTMSSHTESLKPSSHSDFKITTLPSTDISISLKTDFTIDSSTSSIGDITAAAKLDSITVDKAQFSSRSFVFNDDSHLLPSSSSSIYPSSTKLISRTSVPHGEPLTTVHPTATPSHRPTPTPSRRHFITPSSSVQIHPSTTMVAPDPTASLIPSRNATVQVPSPVADIPLGLVIALPVCISVIILICVLALLYLIRQKGQRKERTNSDKELWMNTMLELPPLPPSPASLENGHIIPLSEVESPKKGLKHEYEVTQAFEAKLDSHLSLTMGQTLSVFEKADNGWWRGCRGNKTGWFPGDHVKKINEETNKPEILDVTSINEETLDGSRLITHPIKPAVSSFLIRKKGLEDKSPAELVKENKNRKLQTDKNGNGVISNGNIEKEDLELKEKNELNKDAILNSPEDGSIVDESADILPPPIDDDDILPPPIDEQTARYRVVYPYVAAREGELTLQENDVLSFLGEGSIGWVRGRKEATEEEGWVPASYLQLLNEDTMHKSSSLEAFQLVKKQLTENRHLTGGREHFVGFEHYAVYPYTGQHPGDLTFEPGDSIIVLDTYETGWWHGMKGETTGWFPGSYVELKGSGGSSPSGGIYDRGGNLLSDGDHGSSASGSLTPSRDSYQGDLIKTLGEALARRQDAGDRLSIGSASTGGSDESRPKPARRAPAPPPGGARSVKRKLLRRPSRPAPPPPGPPGGTVTMGDNPNDDSGSYPPPPNTYDLSASGNTSINSDASQTDSPPKQKPPPPKRSVAPKMVKVHKKKLNLENSNKLPPHPDRPVPPNPPASSKSKLALKNFKKKSKKSKIADSKNRGSVSKLTKADISAPMTLENLYAKETEPVSQPVVSDELPIPASQSIVSTELQNSVSQPIVSTELQNSVSQPIVLTELQNPVSQPIMSTEVHNHVSPPNVLLESPNPSKVTASILREKNPVLKLRLEKSQSHSPPPVAPKPKANSSRRSQKPSPKRTFNEINSQRENSFPDVDSSHSSVYTNGHKDETPQESHMNDMDVPVPKPRRRNSSDEELNTASEKKRSRKKSLKKAINTYSAKTAEELSFEEGSFIKQIEEVTDRPGWHRGMLADGTVGLFHSNHVEDFTLNNNILT